MEKGHKIARTLTSVEAPSPTIMVSTKPVAARKKREATKERKGQHHLARFLGSACGAVGELALFHPVDTVAKRLMVHNSQIIKGDRSPVAMFQELRSVMFRDKLFSGLHYAVAYKVAQRTLKFGLQPILQESLLSRYQSQASSTEGRVLLSAIAGGLAGGAEIVLLPIDMCKVKRQVNPGAMAGRKFSQLLTQEGLASLYRGTSVTLARNLIGSGTMFGIDALIKEKAFGVPVNRIKDASVSHLVAASTGAAVLSILVSHPLDLLKTRVQGRSFDKPLSARAALREMLQAQGLSAMFKGVTPKVLTVGPKLTFTYTVAQLLTQAFSKQL